MRWILHIRTKSSLCGAESQLEVVSGLVGVEGRILKRVGEEPVHQGAEGYAIFPAGGKVLDFDPLFESRSGFIKHTRSQELRGKGPDAIGNQPVRKLPRNTDIFQ